MATTYTVEIWMVDNEKLTYTDVEEYHLQNKSNRFAVIQSGNTIDYIRIKGIKNIRVTAYNSECEETEKRIGYS